MALIFRPELHTYTSVDPADTTRWTSVTTLVSQFKQPFDGPKIAAKVAKNKNSKWYGMDPEEILSVWKKESDRACDLGNFYHNQRETDLLSCDTIVRYDTTLPVVAPQVNELGEKIASSQRLENGIYPEHLIYLKSAGICGQSDLVEVVNNQVHIGDYKGLALDTYIPTQNGFKLMRDIQVNDVIFDGNGEPTTVKHTSEIHYNPCYRLYFDTHDTIVCDHEHKWQIDVRLGKDKYMVKNLTTDELYEAINKGEKLRIRCASLKTQDIKLPIDPYVLGVWLGDGSKATGVITNANDELWTELQKRGYSLGNDISGGGCGKAELRTVYGLRKQLKMLNLLGNKHIPDIYLRSSYEQRLDLLRGLMDTDGSYNRTRNRCIMVTSNRKQADFLSGLISSLGWKPIIMPAKASGFGKDNIQVYHVCFKARDASPFLTRNRDIVINEHEISKFRYIKKIEKIDTVPTKCLAVTSPAHTYLATKSYIKTHNTNKKIETTSYKNWEGISQKMMAPLSHLDDCNLNHYAVQLSLYMYMILRHNPKLTPGSLTIYHIQFEEHEFTDAFGYPVHKTNENGDPIIKNITPYSVPYLKDEVINILEWYKANGHNIKKK